MTVRKHHGRLRAVSESYVELLLPTAARAQRCQLEALDAAVANVVDEWTAYLNGDADEGHVFEAIDVVEHVGGPVRS